MTLRGTILKGQKIKKKEISRFSPNSSYVSLRCFLFYSYYVACLRPTPCCCLYRHLTNGELYVRGQLYFLVLLNQTPRYMTINYTVVYCGTSVETELHSFYRTEIAQCHFPGIFIASLNPFFSFLHRRVRENPFVKFILCFVRGKVSIKRRIVM